jgi:hypothetical protein
MLLLHVRFAKEDAAKRGLTLTVAELADTLRRLGYAVKLRTALGGGPGGACLRSLRHSFLTVSVSSPSGSMSYVLDPRFRDQVALLAPACLLPACLQQLGSQLEMHAWWPAGQQAPILEACACSKQCDMILQVRVLLITALWCCCF